MPEDKAALEAAANATAAPAVETEPDDSGLSQEDAIEALKEVRQQSAGYRTKYAPFRDAFNGLDDASIQLVLDAVVGLKEDSDVGVLKWLDIGKKMAKPEEFDAWVGVPQEDAPVTTPPVEDPAAGSDKPLSAGDIAKIVAEAISADRKGQAEVTRKQADDTEAHALVATARKLGFEPGTAQYKALFEVAILNEVDLEAAVPMYQKEFGIPQAAPAPVTDPPPVPKTSGIQAAGAVDTPVTEKLTAAEKVDARITASNAADAAV